METIVALGHLHDLLCEQVGVYREGMHIRYAKEDRKLGSYARQHFQNGVSDES